MARTEASERRVLVRHFFKTFANLPFAFFFKRSAPVMSFEAFLFGQKVRRIYIFDCLTSRKKKYMFNDRSMGVENMNKPRRFNHINHNGKIYSWAKWFGF